MSFDADALLASLPRRGIGRIPSNVSVRVTSRRAIPEQSALLLTGSYNGFSDRERYRTADLSNWLTKIGCTERPSACDICASSADDEHAENYYDLSSWIGLCQRCHRTLLHGRFARPERWKALLDNCQISEKHWSRLVSNTPFDMAALLRSRGWREPAKVDFAAGESTVATSQARQNVQTLANGGPSMNSGR